MYFTFVPAADSYSSSMCYCCDAMYNPWDSMYTNDYSPMGTETGLTYECWTESFSSYNYFYYYTPYYGSMSSGSSYLLTSADFPYPGTCAAEFNIYWDSGRCSNENEYNIGYANSPTECWSSCESMMADDLVAIDWDDMARDCICQDACDCLVASNDNGGEW
jgi:hypothetical protein